ncbi:MAG TPA: DegV family protein, partial [Anaerolineales bacterium]|nr:DegV family protein [Anaerolineales bacterium]
KIPTTAQPSSGQFAKVFRSLAETDPEVLSIHISSGLSGTIESARAAIDQATEANIEAVDTLTLSGAERYQVLAAAWAVKAGWTKKAILERLDQIRKHTELIFVLETLEYLARGGRIGRVQGMLGSLLKLKPVIRVEHTDGKYTTEGRARTMVKALSTLIDFLETTYGNSEPLWISVMHGQFLEQAENLARMARERLNVVKLEIMRVSPALGVHTGPEVVGIAAVPMRLMEDVVPGA